ncbi:MAG: LemA family protein, partial [Thermoplasmata archaeon]|nr:LemA family protein [Thermoplasmata archaeon]NIS14183.1 LemA family protein [Thermoplasmata archaeon]NIV80748.1 LemA family protein [Thermoplasmata archaeon]NIW90879.1 LemA family protein [Thermoplasmata archaeon]
MELKLKGILGIVVLVVILALVIFAIWAVLAYNDLVTQEEGIDSQWAQVSNEYQRKVDLIPQIVEAVEGYQEYEASTLENVTALRTQWMQAKSTEDQVNFSEQLDRALIDIVLTYEEYPVLQADELVSSLMV